MGCTNASWELRSRSVAMIQGRKVMLEGCIIGADMDKVHIINVNRVGDDGKIG